MAEAAMALQAADRLRRDILRGRLEPGAPIKERDSAAELGVSRTPLREAIRMLAQEGLVVLRPARSPVVANPSYKEIVDQVQVLLALERLSGELACTAASDAELARIQSIHARFADGFDKVDPLDSFETDMAFHTSIAEASHNLALAATHRTFLARLWRVRYLTSIRRTNRARAIEQHSAILSALLARDTEALNHALDHHLGHLAEDVRDVVEDGGTEQDETLQGD